MVIQKLLVAVWEKSSSNGMFDGHLIVYQSQIYFEIRAQDTLVIEFSSTIHFWWMENSITSNKYLKKNAGFVYFKWVFNISIMCNAGKKLIDWSRSNDESKIKFELSFKLKISTSFLEYWLTVISDVVRIWKYSAFQIKLNKWDVYIKTEQIQHSD